MEGNKLLRLPEVEATTGLKKSAIYVRVKDGSFPEPVRLGPKSVAWRFDEVQQWILELPRAIG